MNDRNNNNKKRETSRDISGHRINASGEDQSMSMNNSSNKHPRQDSGPSADSLASKRRKLNNQGGPTINNFPGNHIQEEFKSGSSNTENMEIQG